VITAGKDGSGRQKYSDRYTEVLSFLSDAITGEKPTFHLQPYTRRQKVSGQYRMTVKSLETGEIGRTFQDLKEAFKSALLNRCLCWTTKWHLGLVPRFAKQADKIIVVPGSPVPFVVREDGKGMYHFIGECYIDGIMDGEAFRNHGQRLEDGGLV
jgi:hypothetical protein